MKKRSTPQATNKCRSDPAREGSRKRSSRNTDDDTQDAQDCGGAARVYSELLVEENKKLLKAKIESRGPDRFTQLVVSPEPEPHGSREAA